MLYPPIEPYDSGFLETSDGHRIYWEACGNPSGKPALFLHGGPGGGCSPFHRQFFNPRQYRIILFDQRGCGRSLPHASLASNTTAHLLADIEKLRELLGIERWLLFGGSWGSTLALAYAQAYPTCVSAMVLRGVFTARRIELRWLYQEGASFLFPDAWSRFLAPIPENERSDLVNAYYRRLVCGDAGIQSTAARAWCAWEESLSTIHPRLVSGPANDAADLAMARLETHYFRHAAFLKEAQLVRNAYRLQGIPAVIVQGRYDAVTPPTTAWDLHQSWREAELHIVPDAGHASTDAGNLSRLVMATDRFALV
jgi:proline iminopeptidase